MSSEPRAVRRPIELRDARRITWLAIAVVAIAYAFAVPPSPGVEMIDHQLYRITVDEMREGTAYHAAMEKAFDRVYGTERGELIENVRAFRMPTMFYVFAALPSAEAIWYVFVAVAALSGFAATYLTTRPVLGVLVTIYLLVLGVFRDGSSWVAQYLAIELWAVGPLLMAVLCSIRKKWVWAAIWALAAMLIRETAALVLIAGFVLAVTGRIPRRPWIVAVGAGSVAYLLHARAAQPFIDPEMGGGVFVDGSSWTAVVEMMSFGLPLWWAVGPVLWLLAIWRRRPHALVDMIPAAPLLLPIFGLLIDRKYWGILVVPLTLLWGTDQVFDAIGRRRRAALPKAESA